MRGFAWISLVFATVGGCATTPGDGRFAFGIIGDTPYTKVQEREYQNVLKVLNATELAFVVHVGDFQFDARPYNQNPAIASMPCVEESYRAIYDSFQSVRHPFVLTPGDNDWTDCWPLQAVKVDPLQLLSGIRAVATDIANQGKTTVPYDNFPEIVVELLRQSK